MKNLFLRIILCVAAVSTVAPGDAEEAVSPMTLWYPRPATNWTSALPIGNGRLGAMIFGGVEQEKLQLNEDTLWAGGPYDPNNPEALAALSEARRLIFEGKYAEANKLIGDKMMSKPVRQMPYETVGDLLLNFPTTGTVSDYRRELDLDTAVARVSYTSGGVKFTREIFSSPVDQVIVVRLTASQRGQISLTAGMKTPQKAEITTEAPSDLVMRGVNGEAFGISGALKFQARVRVLADGGKVIHIDPRGQGLIFLDGNAINDAKSIQDALKSLQDPPGISVANADSVTLLIAAATSYKNCKDVSGDPEAIVKKQITGAGKKSFKKLLAAHVAEHQRLFRRVALNVGETDAMQLPTDERIKNLPRETTRNWPRCIFNLAATC